MPDFFSKPGCRFQPVGYLLLAGCSLLLLPLVAGATPPPSAGPGRPPRPVVAGLAPLPAGAAAPFQVTRFLFLPDVPSFSLEFSDPVAAASLSPGRTAGIRAYGAQAGRLRAGTYAIGSTAPRKATFVSNLPGSRVAFQAGEQVSVSVPATVQSTSGLGVAKRVYQFTMPVRGAGHGNFQPPANPANVPVANFPTGLTLGDVDGDGDLDLVTANTVNNSSSVGGNTVSVRLNGGDATGSNTGIFSNGSETSVGADPRNAVLADVDGDGDLDVLTATRSGKSVSVRLNGGDATGSNTGTFSNGSEVATTTTPFGLALGDVDADGDLDLLVVNTTTVRGEGNTVSVRLNGGDATGSNTGTFSNGSDVSVGYDPHDLALADVDNDGDLDLLTANTGAYRGTTVSVRLNGGDGTGSNTGTFGGGSEVSMGTMPAFLLVADVDGDGDPDIVVANNTTTGKVSVRLNGGDNAHTTGTFSNGGLYPVGTNIQAAALADIDSDGDLDVLVANGSGLSVSLRLNGGTSTGLDPGTFSNGGDISVGSSPYNLTLADVDGDRDLDLLTTSFRNSQPSISIRLNQP